MHPCFILLAVPVAPVIPWLIAALAATGLLVLIVLYARLRRHSSPSRIENTPSKLENPDLLYALIDSMPDWIYIKDHESRFILANKHMASYHGIDDPGEMIGKTDYEYYSPELAKTFYDDEQEIMRSGKSLINQEENLIYPTGEELVLSTTKIPVHDKSGKTVGIVGIGRNITRQKEDQKRLKELSMVASGTENVVVIMDKHGNFEWVNRGFETRYGCSMQKFVQKNGSNLKKNSSNENIEEILNLVRESGKTQTYTSRSRDIGGNDVWYQTNITPILDENGKINSIFLIDVDITGIKKADLQIKQQKYELESQRDQLRKLNARKDRLFSIIAHDLKNPFQSIIGFSDLLRQGYHKLDSQQIGEYVECIYNSSNSAYELLFNLLEWARAQIKSIEINPVNVEVSKMIGEVTGLLSLQAMNKTIRFKINIEPGLKIYADINMVHTIIRNLTSNAIKFTSVGGEVSFSAVQTKKIVKISISDSGVGISEKKLKTLFTLEKSKISEGTEGETGTGLGLLVCQEFLQLNNGEIKVTSQLGKGSVFTISLPAIN